MSESVKYILPLCFGSSTFNLSPNIMDMSTFSERKITQIVARLLHHRGAPMSYLKIVKLLYNLDRAALERWGRPVTYDNFYSMKQGQVLSRTLDLINDDGPPPEAAEPSYWQKHISTPSNREVSLIMEASDDELSDAEIDLIDEIWKEHGHKSRWELRDEHHKLPEYVETNSRVLTPYRLILEKMGKSAPEIEAIIRELRYFESANNILNK